MTTQCKLCGKFISKKDLKNTQEGFQRAFHAHISCITNIVDNWNCRRCVSDPETLSESEKKYKFIHKRNCLECVNNAYKASNLKEYISFSKPTRFAPKPPPQSLEYFSSKKGA